MTTYFINIVQAVFKPSFAALSISFAVAIISLDNSPHSVNRDTINLSVLGCGGLLKPVCNIALF